MLDELNKNGSLDSQVRKNFHLEVSKACKIEKQEEDQERLLKSILGLM